MKITALKNSACTKMNLWPSHCQCTPMYKVREAEKDLVTAMGSRFQSTNSIWEAVPKYRNFCFNITSFDPF